METTESSTRSTRRGPPGLRDPREWHRDYPNRWLAGVCASLAANLGFSVTAVRAGFALLALPLFHGVGIWLYAILWALVPPAEGRPSVLERALQQGRECVAGCARGRGSREDASRAGEPRARG